MCDAPSCNQHWYADQGLVTLDPKATRLKSLLDQVFVQVADDMAAQVMRFPPLLRVADVDRLDYFKNFPQLPFLVSGTKAEQLAACREETAGQAWDHVPREGLDQADHIMPPAACYAVYIHHRDTAVGPLKVITTAADCYRNEDYYDGLRRLKSFTMREIVFIGEMEAVTEGLNLAREQIKGIADALGLQTSLEQASDPFFDPNSTRALAQKLFPTKQEIICDDLAIGSANFHRNFFGERFGITSSEGKTAFTACIGMGLERWIHVLLQATDQSIDEAIKRVGERLGQSEAIMLLNPAARDGEEMANA
jgi:seryl-tRNA synthetase